jgi:hypothetical protein
MASKIKKFLVIAEPFAVLLIAGGAIMLYTQGLAVTPPAEHIPSILGWVAVGVGAGAMTIENGYLSSL